MPVIKDMGITTYLTEGLMTLATIMLVYIGVIAFLARFVFSGLNQESIYRWPITAFVVANLLSSFVLPIETKAQVLTMFGADPAWSQKLVVMHNDAVVRVAVREKAEEHYTFELMDKEMKIVAKSKANVRLGPSTDHKKMGTLSRNDVVAVLGKIDNTNWYLIQLSEQTGGYIHGSLLQERDDESNSQNIVHSPAKAPALLDKKPQGIKEFAVNQPIIPPVDDTQDITVKKQEQANRNDALVRIEAAKAREKQYLRNVQAKIRDFDFYDYDCEMPDLPSVNADSYDGKKFVERVRRYSRCLDNEFDNDVEDLEELIISLDGSWKEASGGVNWGVPGRCECQDDVGGLWDVLARRKREREDDSARLDRSIDELQDRLDRLNWMDDLQNRLDENLQNDRGFRSW
ncbi:MULTISPECIES: SH3 domain-containing protein [unclassified Neptuniibacter]|uniref:SH3 domain-containing protein n=1 Tax=unclassified Neptuniibacter TaxID=2630693 RepID=UPI000C6175CC|nr:MULTISPECIES: SH3 domain-containing protein [unclassified Neptuniibacter]MAY42889.1 hypothetical protein [Oceanospirillaceae bacterium]